MSGCKMPPEFMYEIYITLPLYFVYIALSDNHPMFLRYQWRIKIDITYMEQHIMHITA